MSQYSKNRDSNIELLRIVAMFLVLLVHADFYSFDSPSIEDLDHNTFNSVGRIFLQSLSIACVDIFVMISGWFGIKPSLKGFLSFIFQCLYFLVGVYVVCAIVGISTFSVRGLLENLLFVKDLDYWFIKSFIILYLFAPMLNAFVNTCSKKQLLVTLIAFYAFQSLYGWLYPSATFFEAGYSPVSFMGLYLLARYIRLYPTKVSSLKPSTDAVIILGLCILQTIAVVGCIELRIPVVNQLVNYGGYINPLTILTSAYFVLCFSKITIQSKAINWVAGSSFAVYLFSTHKCIFKPYFKETIISMASFDLGGGNNTCFFNIRIYGISSIRSAS